MHFKEENWKQVSLGHNQWHGCPTSPGHVWPIKGKLRPLGSHLAACAPCIALAAIAAGVSELLLPSPAAASCLCPRGMRQ